MKKYFPVTALLLSLVCYSQQPVPNVLSLAHKSAITQDTINFGKPYNDFSYYSKNYDKVFKPGSSLSYDTSSPLYDVYQYPFGQCKDTSYPMLNQLPLSDHYRCQNDFRDISVIGVMLYGIVNGFTTGAK